MKTETTTTFKVGDKVAFKMGMGVWMVGTATGKYGTFCVAPEDCGK
jgi:hypothetical protein